jgi:hypothetical protein
MSGVVNKNAGRDSGTVGVNLTFQDDTDTAKECTLVLSGITSSNNRTLTMADQNIDLTPTTGTYAAAGSGVSAGFSIAMSIAL